MKQGMAGIGVALIALAFLAPWAQADETQPIRIYGSTGMSPWVEQIRGAYMKQSSAAHVALMPTGTMKGIQALSDGNAEIAMASRPIREEERKTAQDKGIQIRELRVGVDGIVFFVHRSVPVDVLSIDQIKKVFSGACTRWGQLGGSDRDIRVNSLAYPLHGHGVWLKEDLMKGADFRPGTDFRTSGKLLMLHCAAEEDSIGYLGLADYNTWLKHFPTLQLKVLKIRKDDDSAAIAITEANIRDRSYPFTLPYYLYYDANADERVKNFVQFCLDHGDKLIGQAAMHRARAQ
ncbi:MAG: PstS family phosphate ABC transporter substrate-binding protein [Thermodesulfobacteriota bacterium]